MCRHASALFVKALVELVCDKMVQMRIATERAKLVRGITANFKKLSKSSEVSSPMSKSASASHTHMVTALSVCTQLPTDSAALKASINMLSQQGIVCGTQVSKHPLRCNPCTA